MRAVSILLLALAGCAAAPSGADRAEAPAPVPAPDGETEEARLYRQSVEAEFHAPGVVAVRIGATARLGDVSVRPIRVVEDSRCPRDVECVWAGRLTIRAAISGLAGESELILGRPLALPGGGTLTLVVAAPVPWSRAPAGVETGPASRFGFRRDP